jgi:hypothetical protein
MDWSAPPAAWNPMMPVASSPLTPGVFFSAFSIAVCA